MNKKILRLAFGMGIVLTIIGASNKDIFLVCGGLFDIILGVFGWD